MAISLHAIDLTIERLPDEERNGGVIVSRWMGTWRYPDGESEDEWYEALGERCTTDRVLEDWFDVTRHSFDVTLGDGAIVVVTEVRDSSLTDKERDEVGREIVGIVQGLIFEDEEILESD